MSDKIKKLSLFIASIALATSLSTAFATDKDSSGTSLKEKAASVGEAIDDTSITAKIKGKFAKDDIVSALDVHVETNRGVVTLSGSVPTKAAAERAKALAENVKGVHDVVSNITINSNK